MYVSRPFQHWMGPVWPHRAEGLELGGWRRLRGATGPHPSDGGRDGDARGLPKTQEPLDDVGPDVFASNTLKH